MRAILMLSVSAVMLWAGPVDELETSQPRSTH